MAAQAGVSIVPVAIKNTDHLMGKGTGEARAGTIEMVMLRRSQRPAIQRMKTSRSWSTASIR